MLSFTPKPEISYRGPYPSGIMNGDATTEARIGSVRADLPVGVSGEAVFGDALHLTFSVDDPTSDEGMRDLLNVKLGENACKLLIALAGAYLVGRARMDEAGDRN